MARNHRDELLGMIPVDYLRMNEDDARRRDRFELALLDCARRRDPQTTSCQRLREVITED